MKNLIYTKQKRSFQILTVIGLSFLLHACGNKDGNNSTPQITHYGVMADRTCWQSNGQMAPNPASCQNAPYIANNTCYAANGQPLPSIRSCTPTGWYMEMGVCKNGDAGVYGQQTQYGGYGYQQPYGNGQCGVGQNSTWNQQYGYNPATGTFNSQQYNQGYRPYQGYQPSTYQGYQPTTYQGYQQQWQNPSVGYQQSYTQPTSYWGSSTPSWSSGYQYYTGYSN